VYICVEVCTNPGHQVSQVNVTLLEPRIFRGLTDSWKICLTLYVYMHVHIDYGNIAHLTVNGNFHSIYHIPPWLAQVVQFFMNYASF
jgi:hypothetical protein